MINIRSNNIIKNVNQLEYNTTCLISGEILDKDKIEKKNVIKLVCGHSFKYDLFLKSFRIVNKNKYGYNKCPYCFSNIGRIPIILSKEKLHKIAKTLYKREKRKRLSEFKDSEL